MNGGNKKMKNRVIIKQSLLFPVRYYKHFIIVTALFLISELVQEFVTHTHNDGNFIVALIIFIILPLIVLGINLQIIFYAIKDNKGFPKISLRKSIDEAVKDSLLESYYYALTIIITIILSVLLGLFHEITNVPTYASQILITIEESSVIEIIGTTPDLLIVNSIDAMILSLLIFMITLTIMFSLCTISKIDLEVNHDFKQIFNLKYILNIVKDIGVQRYLKFLLLVVILCVIIANLIFFLNASELLGSLLSALLESFTLFFFLYSFTQLYPE